MKPPPTHTPPPPPRDPVARMVAEGRFTLYLHWTQGLAGARSNFRVTNWDNTLVFPCSHRLHPKRYVRGTPICPVTVWFIGPDGKVWTGRHSANGHTLVNVKRTKAKRQPGGNHALHGNLGRWPKRPLL